MNLKLLFCPGFLLLLVVSQNQAGARSISSLQSLPKLLDEDPEQAPGSEERPHEQDELVPAGVFAQQGTELQGLHGSREQPQGSGAVRRFLSHLLSLSRRHRGRSKKGLSRGCFGVRLDRIGSLSGLGC